jgi:hypothetical protein
MTVLINFRPLQHVQPVVPCRISLSSASRSFEGGVVIWMGQSRGVVDLVQP